MSDGSDNALSDKLKVGALREAINQVNNWPLQMRSHIKAQDCFCPPRSKCKTEGKCVVVNCFDLLVDVAPYVLMWVHHLCALFFCSVEDS